MIVFILLTLSLCMHIFWFENTSEANWLHTGCNALSIWSDSLLRLSCTEPMRCCCSAGVIRAQWTWLNYSTLPAASLSLTLSLCTDLVYIRSLHTGQGAEHLQLCSLDYKGETPAFTALFWQPWKFQLEGRIKFYWMCHIRGTLKIPKRIHHSWYNNSDHGDKRQTGCRT